MSLTTYALLYRVFSKCFQANNNVITLWTNFSTHTSLTYLKVVHCTDHLPILLYAKNWVFDVYTFGDIMFPVTHTFWELRLGVVRIRGMVSLGLSGWTQICGPIRVLALPMRIVKSNVLSVGPPLCFSLTKDQRSKR